jgi:hypothetical protein
LIGFIDSRACPGSYSNASLLHCASSVSLPADVSCIHLLIILLTDPADLLAAVFCVFFFFLLFSSLLVDLTGSARPQRKSPKNLPAVDGAQRVVSQSAGHFSPFYGDMPAAYHAHVARNIFDGPDIGSSILIETTPFYCPNYLTYLCFRGFDLSSGFPFFS